MDDLHHPIINLQQLMLVFVGLWWAVAQTWQQTLSHSFQALTGEKKNLPPEACKLLALLTQKYCNLPDLLSNQFILLATSQCFMCQVAAVTCYQLQPLEVIQPVLVHLHDFGNLPMVREECNLVGSVWQSNFGVLHLRASPQPLHPASSPKTSSNLEVSA